jgi:dihydrofolate reductase
VSDPTRSSLRCVVYVGASIDGHIARRDHTLDFLDGPTGTDAPTASDVGLVQDPADTSFGELLAEVDVVVMGRTTYDVVRGLTDDWPYPLPVVVLTSRPLEAPEGADVRAMAGSTDEVAAALLAEGWTRAYVDGGRVVADFLDADLVERVTVTTVPVLLGDGIRLFPPRSGDRWFRADEPRLVGGYVRTTYHRVRGG